MCPLTLHCQHSLLWFNLVYFQTMRTLTPCHACWALLLADYDFVIVYIPGQLNPVADALSKREDYFPLEKDKANCLSNILLPPEKFKLCSVKSSLMQSTLENLTAPTMASKAKPLPHQIVISDPDKQLEVVKQRHDSPVARHFGQAKTYDLVTRDFWWPGIRAYIKDYVKTCTTCQRNKSVHHKPFGLLQPLPIPDSPWTSVSLDFIVKLPLSDGSFHPLPRINLCCPDC